MTSCIKTYHSFSKISGIELNTEKMEILRIGDEHIEKEYIIVDADGNEIISKSIEAIKVCGITYSDNEELAYEKKGPHLTIGDPPFFS